MSNDRAEMKNSDRKFNIGTAWSTDDEIFIESTQVPAQTIKAFYDDHGDVKTEVVNKSLERIIDTTFLDTEAEKKSRKIMVKVLQVLYLALAIWFCIMHHTWIPITGTIFFTIMLILTGASLAVPVWIVQSFSYMFTTSHKSAKRHHAAEHKALNAYAAYKRMPTLDEVKKTTRFAANCGTNSYANDALIKLLGSILLTIIVMTLARSVNLLLSNFSFGNLMLTALIFFISRYLIRNTSAVCTEIVNYGFEKNILTFFQFPFLRRPTEEDLKLSMGALEGYIEMEDYLKEHMKEDYAVKMVTMDEESQVVTIEYRNGIKAECTLKEILEEMDEVHIVVVYPNGDDESNAPKKE